MGSRRFRKYRSPDRIVPAKKGQSFTKLWVLLAFLVVGLLVYAPALGGTFQFDDKRVILDAKVRERMSVSRFLASAVLPGSYDPEGAAGPRALVNASFLLNWQMFGMKTFGYHLVNVLIHVVTSFLVFVLVGQILEKVGPKKVGRSNLNMWLAIFGGAVFLLHPLQSQAVAYIAQRYIAMTGMFYLLSVVAYLRFRFSEPSWKWLLVSWLAALMALSSKEVAVTLPVMIVLMELLVVNPKRSLLLGRKGDSLKKWLVIGVYFLLALKVPAQIMLSSAGPGGEEGLVKFAVSQARVVEGQKLELTRGTYLLTEINVVRTYMRLMVLPIGQALDWDYPLITEFSWWPTGASLLLHLVIIGLGIFALFKKVGPSNKRSNLNKLIALAAAWFYAPLLVTSSVIPIRDYIYEHRTYISMAGFVLFLVFLFKKLEEKFEVRNSKFQIILLLIYAILTMARSSVWASEVKLWRDSYVKHPEKPRTNKNYGFVLTEAGRLKEGIERLEYANELEPDNQNFRLTLGSAYLQVKNWQAAEKQFRLAVELRPDKADGWNNLGVALFQQKIYPEAVEAFDEAIDRDANYYMAWLGKGGAEMMVGNIDRSIAASKRAIELKPLDPKAYANLMTTYIRMKSWQEALEMMDKIQQLDPNYPLIDDKRKLVKEEMRK